MRDKSVRNEWDTLENIRKRINEVMNSIEEMKVDVEKNDLYQVMRYVNGESEKLIITRGLCINEHHLI
jgi:hypothetical protein